MSTPAIKVSLAKQADYELPVLATFKRGLPEIVQDRTDFPFHMYAPKDAKDGRKRAQRILHASHDRLELMGKNYGERSMSQNTSNYAIGVVKPGKNAVKLVDVSQVFAVTQEYKYPEHGMEETVESRDYRTMVSEATELFGSKKRRKELRSQEANKVVLDDNKNSLIAVDSAMKIASSTHKLAQAANMDEVDGIEQNRRFALPPFDMKADTPERIYNFTSILPEVLWYSVETRDVVKAAKDSSLITAEAFPFEFVRMTMDLLRGAAKTDMKNYARMLVFITYLIKMYNFHRGSLKHVGELGASVDIQEHLTSTYAESVEKSAAVSSATAQMSITKRMKTRLLCHICVVALLLSPKFTLNKEFMAALASDLKITVADLISYLREVGCPTAGLNAARLVAPLTLPEIRKVSRSSRNR